MKHFKNLVSYALLELKNNFRFSSLFVLTFSLGLVGVISVDVFKDSIQGVIMSRSKAMLGADLALSSRRPITDKEIHLVKKTSDLLEESTQVTEVYSMVANKDGRSRLVQIKAIEDEFPYYGDLLKKPNQSNRELLETRSVWIYPELLAQLNLEIGDWVKIGSLKFKVSAIVEEDSSAGFGAALAPRLFLHRNLLKETGLIAAGSIASNFVLYKAKVQSLDQLNLIRDQLLRVLNTNDLRVRTHVDSGDRNASLLARLSDFLGLCALAALFLASIGGSLLFRTYIRERLRSIATLVSIGFRNSHALALYLIQILILGGLSTVVAVILSFLLSPLAVLVTRDLLQFKITLDLNGVTLFKAFSVGTLGSMLLSLPTFQGVLRLRPAHLFREKLTSFVQLSYETIFWSVPFLLFFYGLSVLTVKSYFVALLFSVSLLLLTGVLFLFYWGFSKVFENLRLNHDFIFRWALRDFSRLKLNMTISFLALGVGVMLLNIVPQLEATLGKDLRAPEQSVVPEFFLFDIQAGQINPLKKLLSSKGVVLESLSPLVRAKLSKVNGQKQLAPAGKPNKLVQSREEEEEHRLRSRGFNLSYSVGPENKTSSVVKGRKLRKYRGEEQFPGISLEQSFAKRMGWKIGDQITFDVQGLEVTGVVENYRKVKWTSFRPNFFVNFSPGVLEAAPKTFLAAVPKTKNLSKNDLQNSVVAQFPNVSMIDVSRLVEKLLSLLASMGAALKLMSLVTLVVGVAVIYSISVDFNQKRSWDIALLKSIGVSFSDIKKLFTVPFVMISVLASFLGVLLGLVASFVISKFVFETPWSPNLLYPLLVWGGTVGMTFVVSRLSIGRVLSVKAKDLLLR